MNKRHLFIYLICCAPIMVSCQTKGRFLSAEIDSVSIFSGFTLSGATETIRNGLQSLDSADMYYSMLKEKDLVIFKNALQEKSKRLSQQKYGLSRYGIIYTADVPHWCIFYSDTDSLVIDDITGMRRYFFKPQEVDKIKNMLKAYCLSLYED